jgi:pyruvate dehydrogenase E2 component (dihydrolipoamide acetyltransferase)
MAEIITMPKMGFDMQEGTLVQWVKQVGDTVNAGDVVAVIESDKANVEVTSFKSGVVRRLLAEVGAVVPVGQPIAIVGAPDEDISQLAAGEPAAAATLPAPEVAPAAPAGEEAAAGEEGRTPASPLARRMAGEMGVDLASVRGSGPGGRVTKEDVEAYQRARERAPVPAGAPPPAPVAPPGAEEYVVERATPMRLTIARRMMQSKQQVPHFYLSAEVDMDAALALRQQLNNMLPEEEQLTLNDLIVKASAVALKQFPRLNAAYAGEEVHLYSRVNIGIAVAHEQGLVVTVIKDCDRLSLGQLSRQAREQIRRARQGRMQAEDMVGGTFTISNLGMYGIEEFLAIINPPQAAALAAGQARRVPVVSAAGQVVPGTRMKITVSADHRVTDGAEAALFVKAVKAALEQPMKLVL